MSTDTSKKQARGRRYTPAHVSVWSPPMIWVWAEHQKPVRMASTELFHSSNVQLLTSSFLVHGPFFVSVTEHPCTAILYKCAVGQTDKWQGNE